MGGEKGHHGTPVHFKLVSSRPRIHREAGVQTAQLTFKNASFCWWKCLSYLHQRWSHILHGVGRKKNKKQNNEKSKNFLRRLDQTPVGARRLMKAMLLRHILLKKMGQAGFMMKCSRRIRSSVNKVLCGNRRIKPKLLWPLVFTSKEWNEQNHRKHLKPNCEYLQGEKEPNLSVFIRLPLQFSTILMFNSNY